MDAHLEQLFEFLRFRSISTEKNHASDVADCAEWLVAKLKNIGMAAELHPTAGHPIVVAKKNASLADRPTVLIYGHYDVQPVDPVKLWDTPPFEPRIENGRIFARGATDNKGQILAHILGVGEMLAREGTLPLNVIFLIEGEEEIGSPNLGPFLEKNRDALRCDVVAISDTGMVAPGWPTLTYSLRGIGALEVKVTGPAMDLHSGIYGGAVMNPIAALVRMLASLHDADGRIAVRGFCDEAAPLQDWEKSAWANLPLGDSELREVTGVPELFGEAGFSALERIWSRPTIEINGITGGYQGEGTKTVIPREASAKLTFRLVPNQHPEQCVKQVREHLARVAPAFRARGVFRRAHRRTFFHRSAIAGRACSAARACRNLRRQSCADPRRRLNSDFAEF